MATIYFTNNADSGDGSLRAAIASAESGDVIAPDPTAFASLETITILLSSALSLDKRTTFDAGAKTVVLDGQSTTRLINSITSSETDPFVFTGFHFVRGKISGGGCFYCANDSDKYVFNRCLFAGGEATNYGGAVYVLKGEAEFNNCVITGSKIAYENNGGGVRVANSAASATFNDCTIVGSAGSDVSVQIGATATFSNCIIGRVGVGVAIESSGAYSAIGFVSAPPDTISNSDWSADAWLDYDLRLTPESPFLTGSGATNQTDFLGHARKSTGAVGAYEGSWLVVGALETRTLSEDVVADYFESSTGAEIVFDGADRRATILSEATIGASTFRVTYLSSGYFATPAGTDISAATFSVVVPCAYGAGVLTASATQSQVEWTATNVDTPVLLEKYSDGAWSVVGSISGGTYATRLPAGTNLRLYDGDAFTTITVSESLVPIDFHPWGTYEQILTVAVAPRYKITTGFLMMSYYFNQAETPILFARVENSQTNAPITRDDVESISYTCCRKSINWATETRTPIEGHENVSIPTTAILDALVTDDDRWKSDETGYNFTFEPDSRVKLLFPTSGSYVITITISLIGGNPIPIVYNIEVA